MLPNGKQDMREQSNGAPMSQGNEHLDKLQTLERCLACAQTREGARKPQRSFRGTRYDEETVGDVVEEWGAHNHYTNNGPCNESRCVLFAIPARVLGACNKPSPSSSFAAVVEKMTTARKRKIVRLTAFMSDGQLPVDLRELCHCSYN